MTFVGRGPELEQALSLLDEALVARGRVLLVSGEPGIGKSRFADELARRARGLGFRVAWGRCWEAGGAPAFWPWVQSLRSLINDVDLAELRIQVGDGAADLAHLLPEVDAALGPFTTPDSRNPDEARFKLFDSTTAFLRASAGLQPLMLVLDDLQAADTPSLLLLRFAAGALGEARIVVVGTYRDPDPGSERPLAAPLTELAREPAVHRINLRGLGEEDVGRLINATTGHSLDLTVVRSVHEQTLGNPLFVAEMTRLMLEEGGLDKPRAPGLRLAMPSSVRDAIDKRLRRFPPGCLELLTLASVIGREFDLETIGRLSERTAEDVVEAMEEAIAAGVIGDVPGTRGRLRFSHVVIRQCLYDQIGLARRLQLHRAAAHALEERYADDIDAHLSELALHFFESGAGDDGATAVEYARRAGDRAVALLAYEEAARMYEMALHGLQGDQVGSRRRCELLLALGNAQGRGGDEAGSKNSFNDAAALARKLGLRHELAQAALGYGGRLVWVRAGGDKNLIALLKDGLVAVGDADSEYRARLLARLAGALRDDHSPEPRESLGREAVSVARRLGDPGTLAYALDGMSAALWNPDLTDERLRIADELIEVGRQAGDWERVVAGHQYRSFAYMELGDMRSVHREADAVERATAELRQPAHLWLGAAIAAQTAALEGRFDEAERFMLLARNQRGRTNFTDAVVSVAMQLFQLRREQGLLSSVEEPLRQAARDYTWYPMLRCALAVLYAELSLDVPARMEFEELAADDFEKVPFDNNWMFGMAMLSEAAVMLGDASRAQSLYQKLLRYGDRNAVAAGDGCTGSVQRHLAMLAALLGRTEDAERHYEQAIAQNDMMNALPWGAHSRYGLAALMIDRNRPGDAERASALLQEAMATCEAVGLPALQTKVAEIQEHRIPGVRAGPPAAEGTFRLEGEYWTVVFDDRVLRLRDSKGMRILARLLAEPNRPNPSLDLERIDAIGDKSLVDAVARGDAGEVLDDEARRSYRARIAELREAIADAEGWGKADQAGEMKEELEFITRELSRGIGFGGRARLAGSVAERARLNVTRALKASMQRIADVDQPLAAHLEATVRTGTVCIYAPDPRSPIAWKVKATQPQPR